MSMFYTIYILKAQALWCGRAEIMLSHAIYSVSMGTLPLNKKMFDKICQWEYISRLWRLLKQSTTLPGGRSLQRRHTRITGSVHNYNWGEMQESSGSNETSGIMVGDFPVPYTAWLREIFASTHNMMSASLPSDKQFSFEEQEEMFVMCENEDPAQQASNRLELIHYLARQGVPVPKMHRKLRSDPTPSLVVYTTLVVNGEESERTVTPQQLARRIHLSGIAPRMEGVSTKKQRVAPATLVFMAPEVKVAVA